MAGHVRGKLFGLVLFLATSEVRVYQLSGMDVCVAKKIFCSQFVQIGLEQNCSMGIDDVEQV